MTPERYEQIGRLYHAALDGEPAERATFLSEACGSDEALRREVESLIAAHDEAGGFIEQSPDDVAAGWQAATNKLPECSFAHFQLHSLLGKGGMGEVWLAEDTRLGRKVAVKLLPAEFTTDLARVRRFAQEARAASALNHPNIITIYEIGEASREGMHYIVTEYVAGETLRERMMSAPQNLMPVAEALDVATQIAAALAAAHEAGIIHRDIKPENVMARRDGLVKVLDFGLAKLTEAAPPVVDSQAATLAKYSTEAGVVMGTPRYMSPEQARGEKTDARTDIFSLGVMLYEMIAGRAPFAGATTSEVIAAILRDAPPPLAEVAPEAPPELERIVGKALQKSRAERYQTANDLLTDLRQLQRNLEFASEGKQRSRERGTEVAAVSNQQGGSASGTTLLTKDPVATAPGSVPSRRRAILVAVIALAVAATAALAAWFYFHRSGPPPGKDTVLLADFDNKTGDDIFDGTLKQGLATQLGQSSFLNVFPEVRVQQTLRQMERAVDTRVTPELAREICERQNLKAFIASSIAPLGSHYVITLAALRGGNGEELARAQATAENKEQVLQALTQAAAQLRAQLGESLSSIQLSDQPLEQAMTGNLQALKAYTAGRSLNTAGRVIEGLPLLKRAVELDPQFTSAFDMIVICYFATDQPEAAAEYQAKNVRLQEERAAQSKYPVSESFKLDIATWYQRLVTGNLNKSLELCQMRRQMFPGALSVRGDLSLGYLLTGQFEQVLALVDETIRLNPNFAAQYRWRAESLIRLNRFAEAKDTVMQALQLKLGSTEFHTQLYQLAFIQNAGADAAGMQQQLAWAQGQPDEYVALNWQTGAAAFSGRWRQAQEFSRRAIEIAARSGNLEVAARYATEQALRSAVLGDCRLAKSNAAQGLAFRRGRLPLSRAALALALCDETNQAKPMMDELAKRYPEDTLINEVWLPTIRAGLALQRGVSSSGTAQAIERLQTASRYEAVSEFWPQYVRGQAYLKLGRGAEAAAEFQKILDHRGYAPLSPLYPLAHLGVARAAALTGDLTQSSKAYEAFFAVWKEADADLPILRDARREYELVAKHQAQT